MSTRWYFILLISFAIGKSGFSQQAKVGKLLVEVIDSVTRQGIPDIKILLNPPGSPTRKLLTLNDGRILFEKVPVGVVDLTAIIPTEDSLIFLTLTKTNVRISIPDINFEQFNVHIPNPKYYFSGEISSQHGTLIDSAKVIFRTNDFAEITFTDEYGVYRFTIPASKFKSAKYSLDVIKKGFEPYENEDVVSIYNIKFEKNVVLIPIDTNVTGFIRIKKFINEQKRKPLQLGLGFGVQTSGSVKLDNIPSDIRHIPVHPDDRHFFYEEPARILDTINPTNYTLLENSVNIPLKQRFGLVLFNIGLYGLFNIEVKTTSLKESPETINENYYVKQYLKPEPGKQYEGSANIFYSVVCKERQLFSGSSFSLPVSLSYPLLYIGKKPQYSDRLIINLSAGTNVLLPSKVDFQAISGWERFNAQEIYQTYDIGSIKEVEWFGGLSITGSFSEIFRYYFLFNAINTTYKSDLIVPIQIQTDNAWSFSMNFRVAAMIGSKSKKK